MDERSLTHSNAAGFGIAFSRAAPWRIAAIPLELWAIAMLSFYMLPVVCAPAELPSDLALVGSYCIQLLRWLILYSAPTEQLCCSVLYHRHQIYAGVRTVIRMHCTAPCAPEQCTLDFERALQPLALCCSAYSEELNGLSAFSFGHYIHSKLTLSQSPVFPASW